MQDQWTGQYMQPDGNTSRIQLLDETDLESFGSRDQMIIRKRCVLLRAPEWCQGVAIDLKLPPNIKAVIVHKLGNPEMYCYFRKAWSKSIQWSECQ